MAESLEDITARVQGAAARTSATDSARLSFGLHIGAPPFEEWDQLGEGVVNFAARVAQVSRVFLPRHIRDGMQSAPEALTRPREMLYDGATELMRSGDSWFAPTDGDRDGPHGPHNPLWPLDVLFGANDDIIEAGTDIIRDATTTYYRLTVDIVAADQFLPAGVAVPGGPFRLLRELPVDVWLDDAGLVRRIAIQNTAGDRDIWQVTEFWDFGVAVAITPPDADQITIADPADMQRIFMGDS